MNNTNANTGTSNTGASTSKNQPQVDKDQNPSSPLKMETSVQQDKADASRQDAKVAPAKDEASSETSRR